MCVRGFVLCSAFLVLAKGSVEAGAPRQPPAGAKPAAATRDITVGPAPVVQGKTLYANSWAAVIGINRYRHPGIKPLEAAVGDAQRMRAALLRLGFPAQQVFTLTEGQATKAAIENLLGDRLRRLAQPEDRVVVFFAGHGTTEKIRGDVEEGYILPVDADLENLFTTAISMTTLKQIAARQRAKHVLFAVDACYSGYAIYKTRGITNPALVEELTRKPAVQILTAGRAGDLAQEREGQGLFTKVLIAGLEGQADQRGWGWVSLNQLGDYVQARVFAESDKRQLPQYGNLDGEGQFVFVLPQSPGSQVQGPAAASPGEQSTTPPQLPPIALIPPPPPARPPTGFLVFQGTPAGTTVLLDGREAGKVDQAPLRLEANAGRYTLRLEAPGYKTREAQIEVKANTEQPIQFELERIIEGLRAGTIQRRGKDNAEMVYIPAGTFTMGDTHGDGYPDEKPTHQVSVEAFWIDHTEVTNAQFARFVQASVYRPQGEWQKYAANKDQHPVVEVTWHDAVAYCRWADKRLPTEAEWEYAARSTDGRKYPWGNTWENSRARFSGNRGSQTAAAVGSYPSGASPFGVLDMAGNVWEWASSLYKPYPYVATDGREDLTASGWRVIRGGSWGGSPGDLRSADRGGSGPAFRGVDLGFRCAQSS